MSEYVFDPESTRQGLANLLFGVLIAYFGVMLVFPKLADLVETAAALRWLGPFFFILGYGKHVGQGTGRYAFVPWLIPPVLCVWLFLNATDFETAHIGPTAIELEFPTPLPNQRIDTKDIKVVGVIRFDDKHEGRPRTQWQLEIQGQAGPHGSVRTSDRATVLSAANKLSEITGKRINWHIAVGRFGSRTASEREVWRQ